MDSLTKIGFMGRTDSCRQQEFATILTYHPSSLTTHAVIVIIGTSSAELIIRQIRHFESFPQCPLTIPILLLEQRADELVGAIKKGRKDLTDIHFTIGMHDPQQLPSSMAYEDSDRQPDLNKITQRLTCLAQDFTELRCRVEFLIQFFKISRIWQKNCKSAHADSREEAADDHGCHMEFSLLNDRLVGFQSQIMCSFKETQSQVQTVRLRGSSSFFLAPNSRSRHIASSLNEITT